MLDTVYHKLVKELKAKQTINSSEKMAQAFLSNNNRDFWREAKKLKPSKKMISDTMDGIQGNKNISEHLS